MTNETTLRACGKLTAVAALCIGLGACGGGGGNGDAPGVSGATGGTQNDAIAPFPTPAAANASAATPAAPAASAPTASAPASSPGAAVSAPAVMPAALASSAPPQAATADVSCGLNGPAGIEAEVLQRLNALRASGAVCGTTAYAATGALAWNKTFLQAAAGHSTDMAQKNYFSHTGQDGRSPSQRVTEAGYIWSNTGENIAGGQRSVEQVMAGWTNSPGHCQNLMNPNFRDVAVACVRNDASTYRLYWTMNLGRSR